MLIAEARDYMVDHDKTAKVVFDCPPVFERLETKCVILGKERQAMSDGDSMHYVLLVHLITVSDHDGNDVYERLWAGVFPGKCIDSYGVNIRIH